MSQCLLSATTPFLLPTHPNPYLINQKPKTPGNNTFDHQLVLWLRAHTGGLIQRHVLAHTPVFALPGVEVHESRKWLPQDREGHPEDGVPDQTARRTLHFLQWPGNCNEGNLQEHSQEGHT